MCMQDIAIGIKTVTNAYNDATDGNDRIYIKARSDRLLLIVTNFNPAARVIVGQIVGGTLISFAGIIPYNSVTDTSYIIRRDIVLPLNPYGILIRQDVIVSVTGGGSCDITEVYPDPDLAEGIRKEVKKLG